MSDGFNQVTLFGNLGADPELRMSAKGAMMKMRLATERSWRNKDTNEREKRTEWHSLTMFGPRAEAVAKLLHKGSRIMVTGHLVTSNYDKDGQKHYRTEIVVDDLCFASGPSNGAFAQSTPALRLDSSELPF